MVKLRARARCIAGLATISAVLMSIILSCASPGQAAPPRTVTSPEVGAASDAGSASETGSPEGQEMEEFVVEYQGVWEGALEVQGQSIGIAVTFLVNPVSTPDGHTGPVATMDIPAQMAFQLPLSDVRVGGASAGSEVHFELATGGPRFVADGTVGEDGAIAGAFTQGPATGEFNLRRVSDFESSGAEAADGEKVSSSSDEPANVTLDEREVSVHRDGVTIHGTLLLPETDLPVPVVVLVVGSGPTDRDGNSRLIRGANNGHRILAEELASRGIATVRYDKRGIGESLHEGFREEDLTFSDYVNDLLVWSEWADSLEETSRVFLAGHSEGSLVVLAALGTSPSVAQGFGIEPEAAATAQDHVAGAISIAGPGRPFAEITMEQLERNLGPSSPLVAAAREITETLLDGGTPAEVPQELSSLFRPSVFPYLRSIFRFDPAELAASLPAPLLIVAGSEDLQVPVSDARALAEARPDARLVVIQGMNHVLKMVPEGDAAANQRAYADPSFELSGELVDAIATFVLQE